MASVSGAEEAGVTKEANIARLIILAASLQGHRLFINARGMAYRKDGTPVKYGFGPPGASDLCGWTRDGRFAALEVKTETGRIRKGQPEFIQAVLNAGGRAGIVRSVAEAMAVLEPNKGNTLDE